MLLDELIFSINCYISGISSALLSAALILAIVFRTPAEMKNYKIFLLNVSVTDFLISLSMTFLQPVPDSSKKEVERPANDSGISYVITGPVVYFIHPARNHMLTCLFVGLFLYSIIALPISFFFRYISLCHPLKVHIFLEKKVLGTLFVLMVLLCFTAAFLMWSGDMPKQGPAALVKDWSEYYTHYGDDPTTPRFGNLIHLDHMVYYMLYLAAVAVATGYSLLIFSAIQIYRGLNKHRSKLSKKTLEMQKILAISLGFQSCLPIICVGVPLLIMSITIAIGNYTPIINSIAMLIFSYQELLSPLIAIIFVRPYRLALNPKRWILRRLGVAKPLDSTGATRIYPSGNSLRRDSGVTRIRHVHTIA